MQEPGDERAAIADEGLKKAILSAQDDADKKLGINSTPSFVVNGKVTAGAVQYPGFKQMIDSAAAG